MFVSEHNGRFYLEEGSRMRHVFWFLWEVGRCENKGLRYFLGRWEKAREVPIKNR